MFCTMTSSVLHADNTVNIHKAVRIAENMKYPNCILAVCETQPNAPLNHNINEHDIEHIGLDSEDELCPCCIMQANDMKGIDTSDGTSNNEPKHFKNTKGDDTDNHLEETRIGNTVERTIDPRCQANDGDGCYLASTDHRKIVSQYFGRNKRCTQLLADRLWLVWCRKHYQQRRYNLQQEGTWHLKKLELIRIQIRQFQEFSDIVCWDITLHKTEQILLDRENAADAVSGATPATSPVWERFLEPYLGHSKTYEQLYAVLRVIEAEFQTTAFLGRDNKDKDMPAIEFLPSFPKRIANKPVARPKNRAFIPHVETKGKPITSNSASQTVTPEFVDKTATLDITPTIDTVPVLPSSQRERTAPPPMPLEEASNKHMSYFSSSRTDASPSFATTDAVSSWVSSQRKRQSSSPSPLTNLGPEHHNKRRRLMRGIRPKMVYTKIEGIEE